MITSDEKLDQFVQTAFIKAFNFINPNLTNYAAFSEHLSREIRVKTAHNIQYEFDVELDRLYLQELGAAGITGRIFSEESEWTGDESGYYRVIFDPLCNSSLASRTFVDAAVGMSFFKRSYEFIATVILDYQTGVMAVAEGGTTKFYQVQTGAQLSFDRQPSRQLEDAWMVITLENQEERQHLADCQELLTRARRLIINSGHIYWLRLAEGMVDAYLDPFGGEPLYEMFACSVAQQAGCVVTDIEGKPFDLAGQLKRFEEDRAARFYPVAARTPELHAQLLESLKRDS